MKLYLLKRTDGTGYDEYYAYVIAAENETQAREIAAGNAADEGEAVWHSQLDCSVTLLALNSTRREAGIVLDSFNAG